MTFDNRVAMRRAFSVRRETLIQDFVQAASLRAGTARVESMTHWANRLRETNDAEMAVNRLLEVL